MASVTVTPPHPTLPYARARLLLGLTNVSVILVVAVVALMLGWPHHIHQQVSLEPLFQGLWLGIYLLAYVILSFPFDFLGGYLLPHRYNRAHPSFKLFWGRWLRGAGMHTLLLLLFGLVLMQSAAVFGPLGAWACFALMAFGLLSLQLAIAGMVSGISSTSVGEEDLAGLVKNMGLALPKTVFVDSTDPSFVGGFSGRTGLGKLVFPYHWIAALDDRTLTAQLMRRIGQLKTGARDLGTVAALGWNLVGFTLALLLTHLPLHQLDGILQLSLWFTLWNVLGLFALPKFSRGAVYLADCYAMDAGVTLEDLGVTMKRINDLQQNDPTPPNWLERLLLPVPSISRRYNAAVTRAHRRRSGGWMCAPLSLYLSWAGLNLICRASYSCIGRPELWVYFPGD